MTRSTPISKCAAARPRSRACRSRRSASSRREVADARARVEHQRRRRRSRLSGSCSRAEKSRPTPTISSAGCSRCSALQRLRAGSPPKCPPPRSAAAASGANSCAALAQLPAPRSTSVGRAPVGRSTAAAMAAAVRREDRRFGARGVVLGQFGDGVEQPRAQRVVEELRRRPVAGTLRSPAAASAAERCVVELVQLNELRGLHREYSGRGVRIPPRITLPAHRGRRIGRRTDLRDGTCAVGRARRRPRHDFSTTIACQRQPVDSPWSVVVLPCRDFASGFRSLACRQSDGAVSAHQEPWTDHLRSPEWRFTPPAPSPKARGGPSFWPLQPGRATVRASIRGLTARMRHAAVHHQRVADHVIAGARGQVDRGAGHVLVECRCAAAGMRAATASPWSRASRFMSEANAPGAIA